MKNINWTAICFSIVFLLILIIRFKSLEVIDIVFYCLAIAGFGFMGILSLYNKDKKE